MSLGELIVQVRMHLPTDLGHRRLDDDGKDPSKRNEAVKLSIVGGDERNGDKGRVKYPFYIGARIACSLLPKML